MQINKIIVDKKPQICADCLFCCQFYELRKQIKEDLCKNQNILNTETFMKLKWLSKQHSLPIIQYLEYLINEIYEYEHDSHDVRQ